MECISADLNVFTWKCQCLFCKWGYVGRKFQRSLSVQYVVYAVITEEDILNIDITSEMLTYTPTDLILVIKNV